MYKTDLVILAGGIGSRLGNLTKKKPKPLIKIGKKTFLEILIRNFAKYNFKNIYILAGYKGRQINKLFNNKIYNFIKIKCIIEKKRLGTWGALWNSKNIIKNNFILSNADSIADTNIHNFIFQKKILKNDINMLLVKNSNYISNTKLNNLRLIKSKVFFSKDSKYMNGGIYFIKKKLFRKKIYKNCKSLENDIIPQLIKNKKVGGIKSNKYFLDIGTPKNLAIGKKQILSKLKRPAIFLDRDGVINYDSGYTFKWKGFKFKKTVIKALKYLTKNEYLIFIITNQSGIAKGYFKESDFFKLHLKIKSFLAKKNIYINDVKYCPFHCNSKIKKYKKNSMFRKPGNLMIEQVFKEWNIDKKNSLMIGDNITDKIAADKSQLYFEYDQNNLYKQIKRFVKKD